MTAECCYAAFEPRETAPAPIHPDLPCHRHLDCDEPCRMATDANYDDKMAGDETLRALDHIRDMCLDRPCPNCKGQVIDKPQDDLRQCRGCGHVWGFDDTQNLEEFVREFARMEPCVVCGNDSLDEFEVVDNRGRQELICRNCQSVQRTERAGQDGDDEDYELLQLDRGDDARNPEFDLRDPNPRRPRDLACPFCPEMTNDFFEKQYNRDELVRAVCPSCSYVVFFKDQDDAIDDGRAQGNGVICAQEVDRGAQGNDVRWTQEEDRRAQGNGVRWPQEDNRRAQGNGVGWAQEDGVQEDRRAPGGGINHRQHCRAYIRRVKEQLRAKAADPENVHLFPTVRRAMRYLCVKPIDLTQRALQECADSLIEDDDNLGPRLKTMAAKQVPIMAEQLGWTIGTSVGNIMFRTPEGAALTGNVGSIVGRGFCNMVLESMHTRRR